MLALESVEADKRSIFLENVMVTGEFANTFGTPVSFGGRTPALG